MTMASIFGPGDVVLASSHAVIDGVVQGATLEIRSSTGQIVAVHRGVIGRDAFPSATFYKDYSPFFLLPGLVDAHVHLNEPGRTQWEGFWTGTRAAAFGGVTTLVDMPLNSIPPTTTRDGLAQKVKAANNQCWVDVGFYGGIIPGNSAELKPLVAQGVRGFKGFLIDSGVEEFPKVSPADVATAMAQLANEPTTLMFHAEMLAPDEPEPAAAQGRGHEYQAFLESRPQSLETYAIQQILNLAPTAPMLPLHIVHLSAAEGIPILRKARAAGISITAETCFHYLTLVADDIPDGDTRHKCCPPIRERSNQDVLWDELLKRDDSVIQTIVSDHSPCTPDLKLLPASIPGANGSCTDGNFMTAWGGVSSVGLGLPILWTEGQKRGMTIGDVVRWCCVNTARQVGLEDRKGRLAPGWDADIAVFDPQAQWIVEPSTMLFRNKCSPYQGKTLTGMVKETWVRGVRVFDRRAGFGKEATGTLLLEPRRLPN